MRERRRPRHPAPPRRPRSLAVRLAGHCTRSARRTARSTAPHVSFTSTRLTAQPRCPRGQSAAQTGSHQLCSLLQQAPTKSHLKQPASTATPPRLPPKTLSPPYAQHRKACGEPVAGASYTHVPWKRQSGNTVVLSDEVGCRSRI